MARQQTSFLDLETGLPVVPELQPPVTPPAPVAPAPGPTAAPQPTLPQPTAPGPYQPAIDPDTIRKLRLYDSIINGFGESGDRAAAYFAQGAGFKGQVQPHAPQDMTSPLVEAEQLNRAQHEMAAKEYERQQATDPAARRAEALRAALGPLAQTAGVDLSGFSAQDLQGAADPLQAILNYRQRVSAAEAQNKLAEAQLKAMGGYREATIEGAKRDDERANQQFQEAARHNRATEDIARQNADTSSIKAQMKQAAAGLVLTPGEKKLDQDFAKEYNEWTGSGRAAFRKDRAKLEEVRKWLEMVQKDLLSPTGAIQGALPEIVKGRRAIQMREDAQAATQGSLRATLGPQFTEKEGRRLEGRTYDENLKPAQNLQRINNLIREFDQRAAANDSKAEYFQEHGTLKGWGQGGAGGAENAAPAQAPLAPTRANLQQLQDLARQMGVR